MNSRHLPVTHSIARYGFIMIGSILTAAGLEIFLKAHNLIGGGVIGAAVILSYLTEIPLSTAAILFNFPFLLIAYRQKGKSIILPTAFALTAMLYWMTVFSPSLLEPQDILQSTIMGGVLLGLGSGLIIRFGAYIDGMEHQRVQLKALFSNDVNGIFILVNLLTVCGAGLVFGWEMALYSIGAYFIVFKMIDITLEMFEKTKQMVIVSDKAEEVAERIHKSLGKTVNENKTESKRNTDGKNEISVTVSNYEIAYLKSIIDDADREAKIFLDDEERPI